MRYLATIAVVICLIVLTVVMAAAHSWYDADCCHDQDCSPVIKTEVVQPFAYAGMASLGTPQPPTLWVTTRHGRAMVPPNMIPRESKDSAAHACIVAGKVICYYVPPSI